jgi:hypothetical protein
MLAAAAIKQLQYDALVVVTGCNLGEHQLH